MATQTRFDLNAAVENWRNQLVAQPQLTSDHRRELEKHLADSMAELHGRGLNEQESFWLAQKRIGQPQQLAEEFEKANPGEVWRERAFWMVLGLLALSLWTSLLSCIQLHHWITDFWERLGMYAYMLLNYLPVIVLPILLARGRAVKIATAFAAVFRTRWHFAVSTIAFVAVTHGFQAFETYRFFQMRGGRFDGFWLNQFSYTSFPLTLIVMVTWLMPAQKQQRRAEKPA